MSEHVYCVAVKFKMTQQVEQRTCIKFCIKFKHCLKETTQLAMDKAAAMGNWWLAASSGQCDASCSFLGKHLITQVTQHPCSPDSTCDCWLLPKLKSALKGKRFQTIRDIPENTTGQLMAIGRTVWGPKGPTLKGTEASLIHNVSCILYLLQQMSLFFILCVWISSGQTLYICFLIPQLL